MMMAACYESGINDESDKNEYKIYLLLKRQGL